MNRRNRIERLCDAPLLLTMDVCWAVAALSGELRDIWKDAQKKNI